MLGASPWLAFRRVLLPPLTPAVVSGTLLGFARALGEFGSIVVVSGNMPGRTLTAAVLVYGEIESGRPEVAAAVSTALVAVAFGIIVLATGPLWAAKAWGRYWTWDPRLTTSLLSVLVYVAYVVLRAFAGEGEGERKFSAALGVLGAFNLPIIHYSVQKWSGQHPRVISQGGGGISPAMLPALMLGFLTFTLLAVVLLWSRTRVELLRARVQRVEDEALDLGVGEDDEDDRS